MDYNPISGIKRSNRLYGRLLAELDRAIPRGTHSPTERRVLLELLTRPALADAEVGRGLGLERAQLSRTVNKLINDGLVSGTPSLRHRAQRILSLSDPGREAAAAMDEEVTRAIKSIFVRLSTEDQEILLRAVGSEAAADPHRDGGGEIELREPVLSDFSYLLAELTEAGRGLGWGERYVASNARMIHDFITRKFGNYQTGWMAYQSFKPVGACLLVASEDGLEASVGVLYVAPHVRLRGIGRRLLEAATTQAKRLTLHSVLAVAAERQKGLDVLYRKLGFTRSRQSEPDFRFGAKDVWRSYQLKFQLDEVLPSHSESALNDGMLEDGSGREGEGEDSVSPDAEANGEWPDMKL